MRQFPPVIESHPSRNRSAQPIIFLEFAEHLRSLNRTEETIVQRIGDVRRFANGSDPLGATPETIGKYLYDNRLVWAQEYRRKIRSSLIAFYSWAVQSGHLAIDPTLNVKSIRPGKPPRSPIEENDLFDSFYEADIEAQAIIALAGSMGLRRSEIAVLHTRDRNGRRLTVHGKGDRVRVLPLNELCKSLLLDLEGRQGSGFYFRNHRTQHHVHHATVYKRAKRYIGSWCLHSLRHRAATIALRRGGNLREVQELLGHLNLSTTQIYAAVTFEDIAGVSSRISWPRKRGEKTESSRHITIDLDHLSPLEISQLAEAISQHLQSRVKVA